jgi:F420H(2)-dependent quinone reductase
MTARVLQIHEQLYKQTDGRIGHRMFGVPTLLLRTTGRRSAATRTNSLVYACEGNDYLLVASNGGSDRPPAWLHNLRANRTWRFRSPATV